MNGAFVRAEPAKVWTIGKLAADGAEICHQLFDGDLGEQLGESQNQPAYDFVSIAECENDAGAR